MEPICYNENSVIRQTEAGQRHNVDRRVVDRETPGSRRLTEQRRFNKKIKKLKEKKVVMVEEESFLGRELFYRAIQ